MIVDLHTEYEKLAAAIPRPRSDGRNHAIDPAEQPQLTRYCAIMRHIRLGKTFEEAVAYYDRPRGVCSCGAVARTKTGRVCDPCHRHLQIRRVKDSRAADRRTAKDREIVASKPCACGCGALLPPGPAKRTPECAAKYKAEQDRVRARERYSEKVATVKPRKTAAPAKVQNRPHAEPAAPLFVPEKPRPVDVSAAKVTRIPALFPTGLRNLLPGPGEELRLATD